MSNTDFDKNGVDSSGIHWLQYAAFITTAFAIYFGWAFFNDANFHNFAIKIFFAFGLAFEVPIITFLIVMLGISSTESLSKKRPYIIVFAFILGMILTPPDVISQILLALPIWLLFEFGLLLAKLFSKNKPKSSRG